MAFAQAIVGRLTGMRFTGPLTFVSNAVRSDPGVQAAIRAGAMVASLTSVFKAKPKSKTKPEQETPFSIYAEGVNSRLDKIIELLTNLHDPQETEETEERVVRDVEKKRVQAPAIGAAIVGAVVALATWIWDRFVKPFLDWLNGLWRSVENFIEDVRGWINGIVQWFRGIADRVTRFFGQVGEWLNGARRFLTELPIMLNNIIANIQESLIESIQRLQATLLRNVVAPIAQFIRENLTPQGIIANTMRITRFFSNLGDRVVNMFSDNQVNVAQSIEETPDVDVNLDLQPTTVQNNLVSNQTQSTTQPQSLSFQNNVQQLFQPPQIQSQPLVPTQTRQDENTTTIINRISNVTRNIFTPARQLIIDPVVQQIEQIMQPQSEMTNDTLVLVNARRTNIVSQMNVRIPSPIYGGTFNAAMVY